MTSAEPPRRARFGGVRESPSAPAIHAIEDGSLVTICGLPLDSAAGVVASFAPFMSSEAIAEMLRAQIPPCPTCRLVVRRAEGALGEQ